VESTDGDSKHPEAVRVERRDGVLILTINRPERMNALNPQVFDALLQHVPTFRDDETSAVVLTGAGPRAFSAGADLKHEETLDPEGLIEFAEHGQRAMTRLETSPVPVIAAIEGYCLGGGLELALAADLRIAGKAATFGLPEIGIGSIPGWGGTYRLQRMIGQGRAKEVILFLRRLDSATALDWGLVAEVVDDPAAHAAELAAGLTRPTLHFGSAKTLIRETWSTPIALAERLEDLANRGPA
jgi:enoyl-CoA hydratase / 3-hydroxyacyl-CoA dehydrogenase